MMKGMFKRALAGVAAAALAVTGLALGAGAANAADVDEDTTFTFTATEAEQFTGRDSLTYYKLADYVEYTDGTSTVYAVETADDVTRDQISDALEVAGVPDVPDEGDLMAWVAQQGALDDDQSVTYPWNEGATRKFADALAGELPRGHQIALDQTDPADPLKRQVTLPAGVYLFVDENNTSQSAVASTRAMAMIVYSGEVTGDVLTNPTEGREINLKNEVTTFSKEVTPGVPGVGDVKTYTIKGEVPNWFGKDLDDEATMYQILDRPSKGQTIKFDTMKAFVDNNGNDVFDDGVDTEIQYKLSGVGYYQDRLSGDVVATGGDHDSFTIDLTAYMKTVAQDKTMIGKSVVVTYDVEINKDALTNPVTNYAAVNNAGSIVEDTTANDTATMPGEMTFTKTEADGNTPLPGAQFTITRKIGDANPVAVKVSEEKQDVPGTYVVDPEGKATVTSGTNGKVTIKGLGEGVYTVTESNAPEGFSDTFKPVFTVKVEADGTKTKVTYADDADTWNLVTTDDGVIVRNVRNVTQLPLTGAAGTMLFTVLGLLIAGAGALVYMKSRNVKHALRG